jgi:hypothetical protein
MKNLMVYISPKKEFWGVEDPLMIETQIENSLELGWKLEDIKLVTNFEYEHCGVKSIVVSDNCYCDWWKQVSKMNGILELFKMDLIKQDEIYWFHDLDAFEAVPINVDLEGKEAAFTDYGYSDKRWNTGSFFFKKEARDIMQAITDRCYEKHINEEYALGELTKNNENNINSRIKKINITYNFPGSNNGYKYFKMVYDSCELPVQVLHFHPLRWSGRFYRMFDGNNEYGVIMISERLKRILNNKGAYGKLVYRG